MAGHRPARLPGTAGLTASLTAAIAGGSWPDRQQHLGDAYQTVAALHNQLGSPRRLTPARSASMTGPTRSSGPASSPRRCGRRSPTRRSSGCLLTGAIDQFVDSTDAAGDLRFLRAFAEAAIR